MGLFDKLICKKKQEEQARKEAEERAAEERAAQRVEDTKRLLEERRWEAQQREETKQLNKRVYDLLYSDEIKKEREENERKQAEERANRLAEIESKRESVAEKLRSIPSVKIIPAAKPAKMNTAFNSTFETEIKFQSINKSQAKKNISNFVVVDVETTGLKPASNEIVSVAAIRFRNFEPVEKFVTMCGTKKPIPADATAINGITDEMVAGKPLFGQYAEALNEFIGEDNFVAHNAEFDLKFLIRAGVNITAKDRLYYDTLRSTQAHLSQLKSHKLAYLCECFKIPIVEAHNSEGDAFATGMLVKEFYEYLKQQ